METIIEDRIQAIPELNAAVTEANQILRDELEDSAPDLQAEWSLEHGERGATFVDLRLSDQSGESVVGRFAPEELRQYYLMGSHFYHLWGDLLHGRTKKNLKRLHELIREL